MLKTDPWHFARLSDVERIMKTLDAGLVSALAIIEPRRRGKTTFLLEDLQPAAREAGYLTVYVNLASTSGALEPWIIDSINAALKSAVTPTTRLKKLAATPIKKLTGKAKLGDAEFGGEIELATSAITKGGLTDAFAELERFGKRVLFLFDEVHRFADAKHNDIAWSVRSLLDTHRRIVRTIATSSSAASYDLMVTGERKAFNRWFTRVPLEPLGCAFVDHLADVVALQYPAHNIGHDEIASAFETLGKSPKFTRDYLNLRLLQPGLSHNNALALAQRDATRDSGFVDEFERLPDLQRALMVALTCNDALFADANLKRLAVATGTESVSKTTVQRILVLLADKGWIIRHDRGAYLFADSLFEDWIRDQMRLGLLSRPAGQK
jgi:hypothetical protein